MTGLRFYAGRAAALCAVALTTPIAHAQTNGQDINIRPEQQLSQPPVANPPPPSLPRDDGHPFGS